jgi:propane monooxygenase coupling protein
MTTGKAPRTGWKRSADGPRRTVGMSLMVGEETEATLKWIRKAYPDTRVKFRDCYYKIEREDLLELDMPAISEQLGRELSTEMFLVSMSSYYGRMVRSTDKIQIFAEILPDRFKD